MNPTAPIQLPPARPIIRNGISPFLVLILGITIAALSFGLGVWAAADPPISPTGASTRSTMAYVTPPSCIAALDMAHQGMSLISEAPPLVAEEWILANADALEHNVTQCRQLARQQNQIP